MKSSILLCLAGLCLASTAHAATFTVTNTADTGAGSLRQAITDANATANSPANQNDVIVFNIPGGGVQTITPASSLPPISDAVTIDGYTQPGASANTLEVGNNAVLLIELNGSAAPLTGAFTQAGLTILNSGSNSIIRGLVINRFADPRFVGIPGMIIFGDNNVIEGNFIGTDPTGTIDRGNGTHGISIAGSNNRIGGTTPQARNLISGNGTTGQGNPGNGIVVGGSGDQIPPPIDTLIVGNYIGTNAAGTAALPNSDSGIVVIESLGGRIGMPGGRNVISGHPGTGISISVISTVGVPSSENFNVTVQSNYIGTDAAGENAIPNNDGIGGGSDFDPQADMTIGGSAPGEGNLISGNRAMGIGIGSGRVVNIQGNFIGTDRTGTRAIPNGAAGMYFPINPNVPSDYQFTVGGDVAGARNIISGNGGADNGSGDGVIVAGQSKGFFRMRRNLIGTQIDGVSPLGNTGNGIVLTRSATIGGTGAGDGNIIAHNAGAGVVVGNFDQPDATSGMTILGNSMFSNGGLGIDLDDDGVTRNDTTDTDSGPNKLQNFPLLGSTVFSSGMVNIIGTLNSAPNATYRLEFFGNAATDQSSFGEGQTLLGFTSVTTNASGNASFNVTLPIGAGQKVTATATDAMGNTSEFSSPPPSRLVNISMRLRVQAGDRVLIGGFIIKGTEPKKVIIRANGPSISVAGNPIAGRLENPTITLHDQSGTIIGRNDDWRITQPGGVVSSDQQPEIQSTGLAPTDDRESAMIATLPPGPYTAIMRGVNNSTGIGVIEVYDLSLTATSKLGNVSARGFVETGDNVMIGGFIIGGLNGGIANVIARGRGPSLDAFGIADPLADPTLALHDRNGTLVASNDNWRTTQEAEIMATGLAPTRNAEAAIVAPLGPGPYTAILRGAGGTTGVALLEVFGLE
ncbi:MAG TPA: hypothetical protein VF551_04830 [Chthoniobacterales bacterium]